MTVAVVGTGSVGSALGPALAAAGHAVVYGSREPDRADVRALVSRTAGGTAALPAEAVARAQVVVLATPWPETEAVVRGLDLSGKAVLDTTNPVSFPCLALLAEPSGAASVQAWAPGAHVVKAFNTVGANVMAHPGFPGDVRPVMFVAGDDPAARATAARLADDVGFEGVEAGGLDRAAALEALAVLWISHAAASGREFAFGLLRR